MTFQTLTFALTQVTFYTCDKKGKTREAPRPMARASGWCDLAAARVASSSV